jgi:hypothetical protein
MMTAIAVWFKLGKPNVEFIPSNSSLNAPPTTMVGSTKGTVTSALNHAPVLPDVRAITAALGSAKIRVSTVDAVACHAVNQSAPLARGD